MVASYLLDAGERNHNLDDLAQRYLNHKTIKIDELIGIGQEAEVGWTKCRSPQITQYAAEDADVPLRLDAAAGSKAGEEALLEPLFTTLEDAADRRAGRAGVQRHPRR